MSRVAEVAAAAEVLPWLLPHFGAIRSDLSVYHRIDDVEEMGMVRFVQLVEHLHVYDGAYAASVRAGRQRQGTGPAAAADASHDGDPGDIGEAELRDRWAAVLAQEFPEHIAGGVKIVSADEMVRQAGG